MSRLAEALRRENTEATLARTPAERVALALALGDSDVALAAAATGETPAIVRARLARQRQTGRRASRCASVP
jgi:N-acetylmuramic acid 6-phosphate (MurNAc-6-P) etherase